MEIHMDAQEQATLLSDDAVKQLKEILNARTLSKQEIEQYTVRAVVVLVQTAFYKGRNSL